MFAICVFVGLAIGGWMVSKTVSTAVKNPELTARAGKGLFSLFK